MTFLEQPMQPLWRARRPARSQARLPRLLKGLAVAGGALAVVVSILALRLLIAAERVPGFGRDLDRFLGL